MGGLVDLSRAYLEQESMPYLTQRAMWEVAHALSITKPSVTSLNLSGNNFGSDLLPKESLSYLKKLSSITSLDYTNTNLTTEDLKELQLPRLLLLTFSGQINEKTREADFDSFGLAKEQELTTSCPLDGAIKKQD